MILDDKKEIANLINKRLNLKYKIKEEELEKYNSSFVTKTLKNKEIDLIYKLKNKKIFFMIEHQTKIDYAMPLRILEYENEIMRSAIEYEKMNRKNYKLPLIIPIVLYAGRKKWDAKTYIGEVQEQLEGYKEIEFARYNIIDINNIKNQELLKEESLLSKIMLLEKAKNNDELIKCLNEVSKEINNNQFYLDNQKEILIIIIDLVLRKKLGKEKAEEIIKELKGGNRNMFAFLEMIDKENEKIRNDGKREGKKEGKKEAIKEYKKIIIKKLKSMNYSEEEIKKIINISNKELNM